MTDLADLVREDWAQNGTTMGPQSAVIRDWIGDAPYLFAVKDAKKFESERNADFEAADFIAPDAASRNVFSIGELGGLARQGTILSHAIVVLHPYEDCDLQALANAVEHEVIDRVFVLIWAPSDVVRVWLDGRGALNLHTGTTVEAPDPLMIAAAESMIDEQYNGLSSGRGKDAVVQLVRAFGAEGYPVEVNPWLCAYFAAGGTFRHAESIAKLIGEMKKGVKHRVQDRYRANIVQILRNRIPAKA
jgi:hypothetical protein